MPHMTAHASLEYLFLSKILHERLRRPLITHLDIIFLSYMLPMVKNVLYILYIMSSYS